MPSVLPPMHYWWLAFTPGAISQDTHNHWAPLLDGDHGLAPMPSINPGENPVPTLYLYWSINHNGLGYIKEKMRINLLKVLCTERCSLQSIQIDIDIGL